MKKTTPFLVLFVILTSCSKTERKDYPIRPVPFTQVHFNDQFWAPRIEVNRTVTIPFAFKQCELTGRLDNFAIAGGLKKGEHKGDYPFDDTDVYKILEGAAYSLAIYPDKALESYCDSVIGLIAAAQEDDGYLYTCRTNKCSRLERWMGKERWEKLNSHELYNMGHLYEAAVAYYQATGKRALLDVAIKNADLIDKVFGSGSGQKQCPSGHPIIEMALVKLYRVTGAEKYLRLAKFFLDETGYGHDGHKLSPYSQDHMPLKEQSEAVGHAVRAGYLYSGIADIAALTGDREYMDAITRIWENVVTKKLYITGGIGARPFGEGFGENYELPNMTAYCETCASIANVYWNYRLFLMYGDAKYMDVLERTLYNGLLSGVSLSGDRFFYDNPLESNGIHERRPWFGCACCPGNITRFLASVPGYAYAQSEHTLYVNLFATGTAQMQMNGRKLTVIQETGYPWDGKVRLTISPERSSRFSVCIRIPGWAGNQPVPGDLYSFPDQNDEVITLKVNGEDLPVDLKNGYATISRRWNENDNIELNLPMTVRRVIANTLVEDDAGKVALQCGPVVYCAEWPDYPDGYVLNVYLPDTVTLEQSYRPDLLNGVNVINGEANAVFRGAGNDSVDIKKVKFTAIPYYTWENRRPGEMAVWLPRQAQGAWITPLPTIASASKVSSSTGDSIGLNDQFVPKRSNDSSKPFYYWWLRNGTKEWVQYDFAKPVTVSQTEVYWFEFDHYDYVCRVPQSWQLLYHNNGNWMPVENTTPYGIEKDKYNVLTFKPVKTDGLRIEVQLQNAKSGGIIEWKVD
ncbi:MAG: glycoside hydrolase family 127 protein [Bacteroidetes bacterium]|nr:glycoside hydrolase family 127 protein [Bacteroidota bacterium]